MTVSKQLNIKLNLFKILVESVAPDSYDLELNTIRDKVAFVMNCFESEFNYPQNKQRYPDDLQRVSEWLQGLPSALTIPFYYCDIIAIGYKLGMIKKAVRQETQEKEEQKFCDQWFDLMAGKLLQLSRLGKAASKQLEDFLNESN